MCLSGKNIFMLTMVHNKIHIHKQEKIFLKNLHCFNKYTYFISFSVQEISQPKKSLTNYYNNHFDMCYKTKKEKENIFMLTMVHKIHIHKQEKVFLNFFFNCFNKYIYFINFFAQ